MNDAHDNAADDKCTLTGASTDLAIQAFRNLEIKKLQLEVAEHWLAKMLDGTLDTDRYYEETETDRARYEHKREEYRLRGLLPRKPIW